ncbi:MAG: RelA/SpoT domain-containing protein, partial [Streptococcaceae bacterium]|nr:RelA/SpoT domain-containing protein [Streptococcaceae bacterium]
NGGVFSWINDCRSKKGKKKYINSIYLDGEIKNYMKTKTEQLIHKLNQAHEQFSRDFFLDKTHKKVNLSKEIRFVPIEHILTYQMALSSSIECYLAQFDFTGINFTYRVKNFNSITAKLMKFRQNDKRYPVFDWMNDLFGARIVVSEEEFQLILKQIDELQEKYSLKSGYIRKKGDGYRGIHLYLRNNYNYYFPWELQIWSQVDVESNEKTHRQHKLKGK